MRRLTIRSTTILAALVVPAGCADVEPMPDEPEFRVELSAIHQYAEPAGNANPVAELAEMARGAILIPLRDSDGNQKIAADGTRMRASCGAIMVSPSYAVTAAHCVDNADVIDPYLHGVTLEMYAKDPALQTGYLAATNLTTSSSDWHDFQHPQLTASHGYHPERFSCRVAVRCGDSWGNLNCVPLHPDADVALIKCDGHPGNKYGHIDVADDDIDDAPVFMPWAHEVYAIDDEEGDGLFYDHYTHYTGAKAENLHYFGDDRNQLVPLRSIPWEGETSNVKLSQWPAPPNDIRRWTDLSGCHGTSGSPVLQPDPDVPGQWQLLGPAINPTGPAWNNRLCADPDAQGPGSAHLAYAALRLTQQVVSEVNDCDELTQGKGLAFFTWCWLKDKEWMEFDPFPDIWCLSCPLIDWLRFINEPMAVIREESVELQVAIADGVGTRIAMLATAADDEPGMLSVVDAAGQVLAEAEVEPGSVAVLSAKLAEPIGGSIFVRSEGGAIGVTQVQVAASEATVQFTDAVERLGVGSASPDGLETPLVPMSFVSDPRGGFAALLDPGHRMVMTRSALVGGRSWSVGFTAAGEGRLSCGFILESGEEIVQDCRIRRGRVAVRFDRIEQTPVAFFVKALEAETPIVIDDVSLVDER